MESGCPLPQSEDFSVKFTELRSLPSMSKYYEYFQDYSAKLIDYCRDTYQGIKKNPRWFLMRKIGRFSAARSLMSLFYKRPSKSYELSTNEQTFFQDINVDAVVESLEKNGICIGINLPQNIVQEILDFAMSTTCYGNRKPELSFYYSEYEQVQAKHTQPILVGAYYNTASLCPVIKNLENDPTLLAITAKYLNAEPVHLGTSLWWSFPTSARPAQQAKAAQRFHFDLDDYSFVKFFFYLTDVDEFSGPHICIRGSHKKHKFLHQLLRGRSPEKDIVDYYGAENVMTICGEAGFGFAEDTIAFHKGTPPLTKSRLILQIEFATHNYGMQNDLIDTSLL